MTPRKPYRSPFWKPELERPDSPTRWVSEPQPPAAPQPERRPDAPARTPRPMALSARTPSAAYTDSDLALFGKLTAFDGRPQNTEVHRNAPPSKPARVEDTHRATRSAVARSPSSAPYTGRDATLFQSFEASFSGTRQPPAPRPAASLQPSAPTRGYSQADLDAFAKLSVFGRFT